MRSNSAWVRRSASGRIGKVRHLVELGDVGAGDEARGLCREQHDADQLAGGDDVLEAHHQRLELGDRLAAQRVDAGAGRIDGQPADAFDIELEAPVLGFGHDRLWPRRSSGLFGGGRARLRALRARANASNAKSSTLIDSFRRLVGSAHDRRLLGGQHVGLNRVGDRVAVVTAGDDALLHGLDEPASRSPRRASP